MVDALKIRAMNMSAVKFAIRRCLPALTLGIALTTGMASAAFAQLGGTGIGGMGTGGNHIGPASAPDKAPIPAPEAIPGSKPRLAAAPATKAAGDMQPTDALFDAINRGDIASARDALNRGADLNGVNVLGMTPMELSVDLGRNDISFLLLSMRGEDAGRGSRAVGRDVAGSAPASKPGTNAGPVSSARSAPKSARVANTPEARKPVATPRLFANDGGAPVPNAGFLGFGSRSAAN